MTVFWGGSKGVHLNRSAATEIKEEIGHRNQARSVSNLQGSAIDWPVSKELKLYHISPFPISGI